MKKPYKLQGRYWALGINDLLSMKVLYRKVLYRVPINCTRYSITVQYNDTVFQFFIARVLINCPYI